MIRIDSFKDARAATGPADIEAVLRTRDQNGFNEFWLSHEEGRESPALAILVNGDAATLIYFPRGDHPGWRLINTADKLKENRVVKFLTRGGGEEFESSEWVVPFSLALKIALEFSVSESLPKSGEWFEL
jgi:hypothetical protein